jgi:hypothetical protein
MERARLEDLRFEVLPQVTEGVQDVGAFTAAACA